MKESNNMQWLVVDFISATSMFQPNTNVSLKMLGSLLYLAKTKNLCQATNILSNDPAVLIYMDKSYVDAFGGDMSTSWEEKGINNVGICSRLPKDDNAYDIVSKYAKDLREVSDPISIFSFAENLIKWDLSSEDYLDMFDFAIQQYMATMGKVFGEFSQPKEMTKLVADLISSSCGTILNTFAGTLSYATEIAHYTKFVAIEINTDMCELGLFRIAL